MMKVIQKEALDSKIINGAMYILSTLPYEIVYPTGIVIALGCIGMSNITSEIKECFISCFDGTWDKCPSATYILENMKLNDDEQWLKDYRDEVLKDLKEKTTQKEGE